MESRLRAVWSFSSGESKSSERNRSQWDPVEAECEATNPDVTSDGNNSAWWILSLTLHVDIMTLPLHLEQIHIRDVENKRRWMKHSKTSQNGHISILKPSIFSSETRAGLVNIRVVSQDPRQQNSILRKKYENIWSAKKIGTKKLSWNRKTIQLKILTKPFRFGSRFRFCLYIT